MFAELILGAAQLGLRTDDTYRARPSMAGPERCLRQMVYKSRGLEEDRFSSRLAVIFLDGVAHETVTFDILKTTLLQIHSEQRPINLHGVLEWMEGQPPYRCSVCSAAQQTNVMIPATTLHGHLDALARDLTDTEYLVEHKGLVSHIFKRLWDQEKEPLDYLTQCVIYFRGLYEEGLTIDKGALLVKNKDTGAYLELELEYDYTEDRLHIPSIIRSPNLQESYDRTYTGLFHTAIEKFRQVHHHTVDQTLPDRLTDSDDVRCQYCPFLDLCWEDYTRSPLTEHIRLPEGLVAVANEWIQLDRELKPKNARLDELNDQLKQALQSLSAKEAVTDTDLIRIESSTQTRVDQKKIPTSLKKIYSATISILKLKHTSLFGQERSSKKKRSPTPPRGQHESAA